VRFGYLVSRLGIFSLNILFLFFVCFFLDGDSRVLNIFFCVCGPWAFEIICSDL